MIEQQGLTIITTIEEDKVGQLKDFLNPIGDAIVKKETTLIPFKKLKTVHFMRWTVLDAGQVGNTKTPPQLIFSSNFDGSLKEHLDELLKEAEEVLDQIYQYCKGYSSKENLRHYLQKHIKRKKTLYVGVRGKTVQDIYREYELRNKIREFLDRQKYGAQESRNKIFSDIRQFVTKDETLQWALKKPPAKTFGQKFTYYFNLGLYIILGVILAVLLVCPFLPLTLFLLWYLRYLEKHDEVHNDKNRIPKDRSQYLETREDIFLQNQMSLITDVKKGLYRIILLKIFLKVVKILAIYVFNKGTLGGIPSIHFARWVLVDRNKRLLFFSNFDGSWINYLGDFIDKSAVGLTGVWSNTFGFPRTKFLIFAGAKLAEQFKIWARFYQIPTQVWYTAYPYISVQNIMANAKIRAAVCKEKLSEKDQKELFEVL